MSSELVFEEEDQVGQRIRKWRKRIVRLALLCIVAFLVWFMLFTGPRDMAQYPLAANSPYRLPWPSGISHLCVQGNRAVVSHRGFDEFAYDFAMPVGSDVCAARAGVVEYVEVEHDGNGFRAPNNVICVKHDDSTFAVYAHLKLNGSYVEVGDQVAQGQRIAGSGNVGTSMMPHLHFDVREASGQLLPVVFEDVKEDKGIPRMFKSYTSGNSASLPR
jgi:murein DD-endopeptidase MepM/ murein hydrolase activator NlpD